MTRRAIKTSTYIMMPLMMGFAVCAEPFIRLLLTEKWLPCVPYLQVFCMIYAFYPLHTANLNAIKAVGRSDVFLKLEIIKKVIETAVLLLTMRFGVMAMALGQLFSATVSQVINAWPNKRLLDYPYSRQLRDMLPAILLSCVMAAVVSFVPRLGLSDLPTLIIQVLTGAAVYVAGSAVLKLDSFTFLLGIVKRFLGRGKAA